LNNIQFKQQQNEGISDSVVAYIDAPNASQEQIESLGNAVLAECPMARMNSLMGGRNVTWKKRP
jgi:hypothetical protein